MIKSAINELLQGNLVILPTETVYGIFADAHNIDAVHKIYAAKKRPLHNPLIIHVSDFSMFAEYIDPEYFEQNHHILAKICDKFWPGPLTLLVKKNKDLGLQQYENYEYIALRVPNNKHIISIIKQFGRGIVGPSANLSGKLSPTKIEHIDKELISNCGFYLDDGPCIKGIESTIIKIITGENGKEEIIILRPGSITLCEIEKFAHISNKIENEIIAPGMLSSHYKPNAKLVINCDYDKDFDAFLDFGSGNFKKEDFENGNLPENYLNLSFSGDLAEAARNFYDYINRLDKKNYKKIFVAKIKNTDQGVALNDRLQRAAFKDF